MANPYTDFDASVQSKLKKAINLGDYENCTIEVFKSCRIGSNEDDELISTILYFQCKRMIDEAAEAIRNGSPYAMKLEQERKNEAARLGIKPDPRISKDLSDREMTVGATVELTVNLGNYETVKLSISRYQRTEKGENNDEALKMIYFKCKALVDQEAQRIRQASPYAKRLEEMRQQALKKNKGKLPNVVSITRMNGRSVVDQKPVTVKDQDELIAYEDDSDQDEYYPESDDEYCPESISKPVTPKPVDDNDDDNIPF